MIRLENSCAPQELQRIIGLLVRWLQAPEQQSLGRAFTVWIKRVLLPARLPGVELPKLCDLNEVHAMLAERVKQWTEQWKAEGLEEGEAAMLLRLLNQRFGPIDESTRPRVLAADAEQLLAWGDRVLTAESLTAVFGG